MIIIKEVLTKSDLKKFIKFPNSLYRNNNKYIQAIYNDELNLFSPLKNDAYSYCEAHQYLAYKDNKIVGRIATIINHKYNIEKKVKQIRFSRFDVIDDVEVTRNLLEKVKEEARNNDLNEMIGPLGFTNLDKKGILINGFDVNDDFYYPYNETYYQKHFKALGYHKDFEWNMYRISIPKQPNYRQIEMTKFIIDKYELQVKQIKKTDDLDKHFTESIKLRQEANGHKYGYNELSDKQIKSLMETNKFFLSLQYSFIIVDKNDEVVGFAFAAPIIHKKLIKQSGKLNFYNRFRLNLALRKNEIIYLNSMVINQKYQNIGLEQILLNEIINVAIDKKIKYIDTGADIEYSNRLLSAIDFTEKEVVKIIRSYKSKI